MGIGPMEIAIVAGVLVLIFGPRQLPKLGKALGDTVREFRAIGQAHEDGDGDER